MNSVPQTGQNAQTPPVMANAAAARPGDPGRVLRPVPRGEPAPPRRYRGRRLLRGLARHAHVVGFLVAVAMPVILSAAYLYERAADRYGSSVAFVLRSASTTAMPEILGGLSRLTGASASDAAMVYDYLQSQDLVARLDRRLNLRALFSAPYGRDPLFALPPGASLESLVAYWRWTTRLTFDQGSGLITLEVRSFSPADARRIAAAAFDEAARMVDEVSAVAQADATKVAHEELRLAEQRLGRARTALERYRAANRVLDPAADATGQAGLVSSLQDQLARAMIERDMLARITRPGDPRLAELERRVAAIERRIETERAQVARTTSGGEGAAAVMAGFERLAVEREFAETAYGAARAAMDAARQEARRRTLYLAAYAPPGRAESSAYPDRPLLIALVGIFAFLAWSVLSLIVTSLRDRR